MRCDMADTAQLEKLLKLFFGFERKEIADFRAAVEQFKADLPTVLQALRAMIDKQETGNADFRAAQARFLAHAQEAINPALGDADVREMLIQHILTEEIFANVFNDSDFHQHNNVARELYALEGAFFTGALKKNTLKGLETYYAAIRAAAAQISSHGEKQTFLKVIYENFYKVYNTKAADRLGVVYTPNEIVRFMIDGADWLCESRKRSPKKPSSTTATPCCTTRCTAKIRAEPQARIPAHPLLPVAGRLLAVGRLGRGLDGAAHRLRGRRAVPARAHRHPRRERPAPPACRPKPSCAPTRPPVASRWTAKPPCAASRPRPGPTSSATAARWTGCSTSTRKRNPRTPPSARSSTPTALPTTRKRSSTCWPA
jgi:hypothetical protein